MEILADALDLDPVRRNEFLEGACRGDAVLRAEVDRLLNRETAAVAAMNTRIAEQAMLKPLAPPETVGACKILRELGHGGMSVVYLATQQAPIRRLVAVKLLLPGMDTREVLSRFESERQALAVMSHPNVAQVYDAGTIANGRPYFVMEYVDGVSLTEYCDTHRLTTRQRLELFLPVCEAVQHAHQKAIIHRDLKPSNVLVMQRGDKAIPKVIDFGIAKAMDHTAAGRTAFTEHGQLLGTPEYMSPEQASLGGVDIDTRTDVYSLGVLLYELLTGSLPFDRTELRNAAYDEIRRLIREVDPPRPSTRLSENVRDVPSLAAARQSDSKTLLRHVRGDLDWITMKALEKDRVRRYSTPADLAADVRRHLENEVVLARRPTRAYRTRKFIGRHRAAVAVAGLVVVTLAGGVVATTWQAIRAGRAEAIATRQRELAERRFEDVRRLARTLIVDVDETIQTLGPTKGREVLVRTALEYLDKVSADVTETALLQELAEAYEHVGNAQYYPGFPHLGQPEAALASYTKAIDLAQRWSTANPAHVPAMKQLGASRVSQGEALVALNRLDEGLAAFASARKTYEELVKIDSGSWRWPRNIGLVMDKSASVFRRKGQGTESLAGYTAALEIFEEVAANFPAERTPQRDVMTAHANLAGLVANMGLITEAMEHSRLAHDRARRLLSIDPENVVYQRDAILETQRYVEMQLQAGLATEPLRMLEPQVDLRRKALKADQSSFQTKRELANTLSNRAGALLASGLLRRSLEDWQEVLQVRNELNKADPNDRSVERGIADANRSIAVTLRAMGRLDEAMQHINICREIRQREIDAARDGAGGSKLSLSFAQRVTAEILLDQGKFLEAQKFATDAAAAYTKPAEATRRRELTFVLATRAEVERQLGQADDALSTAKEAIALAAAIVQRSAADYTIRCAQGRALITTTRILSDRQDPAAAAVAGEALSIADALLSVDHNSCEFRQLQAAAFEAQAEAHFAQGAHAAGQRSIEQALNVWREINAGSPDLSIATRRIEELKRSRMGP